MPAELSESDARALLERAAATIDVDAIAPAQLAGLPEPRPRHLPVMVAAAAAVVLVVTGAVLVARRGDRVPDVTPTGRPVEHAHAYGPHEMPSLVGYTGAEARRLLEARGLTVRVTTEQTACDVDGQVLRAEPAPGVAIPKGSVVRLSVARNRRIVDCAGQPEWGTIWRLVRFARGVGPAPQFADEVVATVTDPSGSSSTTRLTGDEALNRASWVTCAGGACHSALAGLAEMVTARSPDGDAGPWSPYLAAGTETVVCGPSVGPGGGLLRLWLEVPVDGIFCPSSSVAIEQDRHDRITGISYEAPPPRTTHPSSASVDPVRSSAARRFVGWALGHRPAPAFASRVRQMLAGQDPPGTSRWNNSPMDRDSWSWRSACSGLPPSTCGVGPLPTIRRLAGGLTRGGASSLCSGLGVLPKGYADDDDLVVLAPRSGCPHLQVLLWIDAQGVIRAVDLVP